MPSYETLSAEQKATFDSMLGVRPFTNAERRYWDLCWIEVTQNQVDTLNALMPANHVVSPRELNGLLYIKVDIISDAINGGRLGALFDTLKSLNWTYIEPHEWPFEGENGSGNATNQPPDWVPWDGNNANLHQVGDRVTHTAKRWVSTVPNNHWEPGLFGWKEEGDGTIPPTWRQPLTAGDGYAIGALCMFEGQLVENTVADNAYPPDVSGWIFITPEPAGNEWAVGVPYKVGDEVTYLGITYRCRIAHTSQADWVPTIATNIWLQI